MAPTRREFLTRSGTAAAWLGCGAPRPACTGTPTSPAAPPIRPLTRGPRHHWFGYYDKLQFDPSGRYALGMEVDFEHRSPAPRDRIGIGMVDLQDDDRWIPLGASASWGWQQGCMLQWRPGSAHEVLWNDRDGERFVCRVLDVRRGTLRTVPQAVYTVAGDGRTALGLDFRRVQAMRPGYGYAGLEDPWAEESAPADSGVWRIDLDDGTAELVLTLEEIVTRAAAAGEAPGPDAAKHYVNHLLCNPDGTRFVVLHRWRPHGGGGFRTRMLTAAIDGTDLRVLDASGHTSHFIWRDPRHVLVWTRLQSGSAFYLLEDAPDGAVEVVGAEVMTRNGHCSYLPPDGRFILNDTYPDGERLQRPYLFDVATGTRHPLGAFRSPPEYRGEWRCDTHPRSSPDGRLVCIDSPHGDPEAGLGGRQMWLIDVAAIVDG